MIPKSNIIKIKSISCDDAKLEVGVGWYGIIDDVYNYAANLYDTYGVKLYITEVKEKYGKLTVYYYIDFSDQYKAIEENDIWDDLDSICSRSMDTCEDCGSFGEMRNVHGWYKTLCNGCYNETVKEVI